MALDRGGLDYNIKAVDSFSANFRKFREEIAKSKAALSEFKSFQGAFEEVSQGSREAANATREEAAEQRRLIAQLKERARLDKERGAIIRQQKSDQADAARASLALDAAIARTQKQQFDQQKKEAAAAAAAEARGTRERTGAAKAAAAEQARQFQRVKDAILGTNAAGNRLVFTLRNIIGVGAGLAVIQRLQQGFGDLIRGGISLGSTIEQSTVGMAGLLTAVTDAKSRTGEMVTSGQQFAIAMKLGREQVDKLRQASIATSATFEQLVETFQVALAPGARAGLNLDQIRQLSVSVSQAAQAIGLPQNQLSEEIRALLTGTIQQRTTRIATALGITPDNIRKAKTEVGGLAAFLQDRFAAFQTAADVAAGTFENTGKRARAAVQLVAGTAIKPLFDELRHSFQDIIDLATSKDATGNLIPSPQAVAILKLVFDGIAAAIHTIREGLRTISFDDLSAGAALLGNVFRVLGAVFSGIIRGVVSGAAAIGRFFGSIGGESLKNIQLVAFYVAKITTGLLGASLIAGPLLFLFRQMANPIVRVVSLLGLLGKLNLTKVFDGVTKALTKSISPATLLVTAAIAAIVYYSELRSIITQIGTEIERVAHLSFVKESQKDLNDLDAKIAQAKQDIAQLQERNAKGGDAFDFLRSDQGVAANDMQRARALVALKAEVVALEKQRPQLLKQIAVEEDQADQDAGRNAESRIAQLQADLASGKFNLLGDLFVDLGAQIKAALGGAVDEPISQIEDDLPEAVKKALAEIDKLKGEVDLTAKEEKGRFEELFEPLADTVENQLNLARNAVTTFSSFVGDSIVDAFDPTQDFDIQERFARFLQDIAKQIITTLTQIAIAKLALSVFGGGPGAPVATFNEGGAVPSFAEGGTVSPAHFGIDAPRPAGIPASDTVPAWLTPGEFVQRTSAVAAYGADLMDVLNRKLVDPGSLRAFVGLGGKRNVMPARRLGHADGGLIGQQLRGGLPAGGTSGPTSGPSVAVIAGNDKAMERLLAGGQGAFMRFVRENAESLEGILSAARR